MHWRHFHHCFLWLQHNMNHFYLGIMNKFLLKKLGWFKNIFAIQGESSSHFRSSHPEVVLVKDVLKVYSKFTGEHPYRSVISIKLQSNIIEVTLWHECSPVNLLHIFRTTFTKNTSGWLLLPLVSLD